MLSSFSRTFSTMTVESFHDYNWPFHLLTLILFHDYDRPDKRGRSPFVSAPVSSLPPHPGTGADESRSTWGSARLCACMVGGRKKKRRRGGAARLPLNPCGRSRCLPRPPGHLPAGVPLRSRQRGGRGPRLGSVRIQKKACLRHHLQV